MRGIGPGRCAERENLPGQAEIEPITDRKMCDLLGAGERIVRVPPKLMAHARDAARSYGKSDPIDALAVARAALREPDLPMAHLDGPAREIRLLVDHRDNLVAERTRAINRLRWHLHELDPSWTPPARCLWRPKHLGAILKRLAGVDGTVARLAHGLVERCRQLSVEITELANELTVLVRRQAPALLELCGCATLTAAKIVGETAGVRRFRSRHSERLGHSTLAVTADLYTHVVPSLGRDAAKRLAGVLGDGSQANAYEMPTSEAHHRPER